MKNIPSTSVFRACCLALAVCTVLIVRAANYVATCTWKGDSAGGVWNDPANWTIERVAGQESLSDAEVMAKSCKWVLTPLADGAVLTNTASSLIIGDLRLLASDKNVILENATGAKFDFDANVTVEISSGSTVECRLAGESWKVYDAGNPQKVILSGRGALVFNPASSYHPYKRDFQPCGGSTLRVKSAKVNWMNCAVTPWNDGSVFAVDADVTIGWLNGNQSATKVQLENGHTLAICGGETTAALTKQAMPVVGTGGLLVRGGLDFTAWSGSLGYVGSFGVLNGLVNFSSGISVARTVEMRVDGGGTLSFPSSQTLGVISGKGSAGAIVMPSGSTLTAAGTDTPVSSRYEARIAGDANFVKDGADYTLTLAGDNTYKGDTHVAGGTLALERVNYRHGLVACWTFDDPENLGADSGPSGVPVTFISGSAAVSTQVVAGVGGRPAIHLAAPGPDKQEFQAFRVDGARLTADNGFSKRSGAFAVSFWFKPDLANGSKTAYVVRRGVWAANKEFMLWLNCTTKTFRLSIDNYGETDSTLNVYGTADTLGDGQWHHVVASYEEQKLQLWYDGTLLGESETSGPLALEKGYNNGNPVNVANDNSLIFGNSYNQNDHRLDALFDEVCVWNHALTAHEVAREYALRGGMAAPEDALPEPIAHWRFDDPDDIGKDEKGQTRLVAAEGAPVSAAPALKDGCEPMGLALTERAAMTVENGGYPHDLPMGEQPFSVSFRSLLTGPGGEWGTILYWGDEACSEQKYFRLTYGGSPRRLGVAYSTLSGANVRALSDACRTASHAWVHYTVTFNPWTYVLKIYRDGVLEARHNTAWVDIPASGCFYLNTFPKQPNTGCCAVRFDDLRIYDRELTPYEVRTLARSLKTGTVGPVLPTGSAVTVAEGATLAVDGMHVASNALSGAGQVVLNGGARFAATDWTGFAGRVTGAGELMVAKGTTVALTAQQVSTPVSFEDSTIVLAAANLKTPIVRTSGRVILDSIGTLALADDMSRFAGKAFKVAQGSSYVGPADTTGWTFESDEKDLYGKFQFVDGTLWLRMNGGATTILFR